MYKAASRTTLMDISGKYILKEKTMRHPLMSTRDGKIYAVGTTKPFNPIKTYPKELGTFTNKNAKTPQSVQILDKQWKVCPLDKEKHLRPIQESHITNKNNQEFSEKFHQDMNVSTPILEAVFVELAKDFYTNGDMSIPKHEENTLIHENKISSKTPSVLARIK
jgi:hypothetical protein